LRIGYPAIGAGLGGGDWLIIAQIINKELAGGNHTFVEFKKHEIIKVMLAIIIANGFCV
jgi:O-acetyl-ADP-ribose deacetylase (regulator of RNase III)